MENFTFQSITPMFKNDVLAQPQKYLRPIQNAADTNSDTKHQKEEQLQRLHFS